MLDEVNKIYNFGTVCSLSINEVYDCKVREFSATLSSLQKILKESEELETWREFVGRLKKYRFSISATPLSFNDDSFTLEATCSRVEELFNLQTAFIAEADNVSVLAGRLINLYKALIASGENGLRTKFFELHNKDENGSDTAVVLLNNGFVKFVRDSFDREAGKGNIEVISPHELKDSASFQKIYLFGAPYWYVKNGHSFLFSSPRAFNIEIISYSWINNSVEVDPVFDCPQPERKKKGGIKRLIKKAEEDELRSGIEKEEADGFLLGFDIKGFKDRLEAQGSGKDHHTGNDIVEARLVMLTCEKAVFVEHDESASSFVLSPNAIVDDTGGEEIDEEVEDEGYNLTGDNMCLLARIPNNQLEEGMFMLLRTGGGGDYIVDVADKIMGKRHIACRRSQHFWKALFQSLLEKEGAKIVRRRLIDTGGKNVHLATLRNWTFIRNIRPGSGDNFRAVLKLVGLENHIDEFWQNTEIIYRAHRQAGIKIRKLLLERIAKADLKELTGNGFMVFDLPGIDTAASMTAYRIERILSETHELQYHKLGIPVDIGEDLWL